MSNPNENIVDCVLSCDVLLGRGKLIHFHPGNVEYREIVRARSCEYGHMQGMDRDSLAREIIQHVHDRGGRFLKPTREGSQWTKCSWAVVVTKVKQALRDMVKHKTPAESTQACGLLESSPGPKEHVRREGTATDEATASGGATVATVEHQSSLLLGRTGGLTNMFNSSSSLVEPMISATSRQHHQNLDLGNSTPTAMHNISALSLVGLTETNSSLPIQSAFTPFSTPLMHAPTLHTSLIPSGNAFPSSSGSINDLTQPIDGTTAALLLQRSMLLQELQLQLQPQASRQIVSNAWAPPYDTIEFLQRNRPPHQH